MIPILSHTGKIMHSMPWCTCVCVLKGCFCHWCSWGGGHKHRISINMTGSESKGRGDLYRHPCAWLKNLTLCPPPGMLVSLGRGGHSNLLDHVAPDPSPDTPLSVYIFPFILFCLLFLQYYLCWFPLFLIFSGWFFPIPLVFPFTPILSFTSLLRFLPLSNLWPCSWLCSASSRQSRRQIQYSCVCMYSNLPYKELQTEQIIIL